MGQADQPMDFNDHRGVPIGPGISMSESPEERNPGEEAEKRHRQEKATTQYHEMIADLSGSGGIVIQEVVKLLARRVDEMIRNDPEAGAYVKALAAANHILKFGEQATRRMAEDLLKYAAPSRDTGKS